MEKEKAGFTFFTSECVDGIDFLLLITTSNAFPCQLKNVDDFSVLCSTQVEAILCLFVFVFVFVFVCFFFVDQTFSKII